MKRSLIVASVALLTLAFGPSAHATDESSSTHLRTFIGLWEGVDPVDGGDAIMSITCSRDEICQLVRTEDVVALCGGGPGLITATGSVEGNELVFPDAVATCPDGSTVTLSISFKPDRFNRTIVSTSTVNGEPLRNITYHKISW